MAWGDEYTTVGNYGQNGSSGSAQTQNSNMNWGGLVNGATSLYELYNAYQASKKPKLEFQQPPLSPEQRKMWDLAYRAVSTLPTAQMLGPMAQSIMQGYSGMGWKGANSVAVPYYGIEAGGPSYSSPNTTYQLGPAFWPTPQQGRAGARTGGEGAGHPGTGGGVRNLQQRDVQDEFENLGGAPRYGEDIGSYLFRNPGGRPQDYLPNGGETAGPRDGMSYGEMPQAVRDGVSKAWQWAQKNGGWEALLNLGVPGLGTVLGVGVDVAQGIWNLINRGNRNGGNAGSNATSGNGGSGFIPGSVAGGTR